jgi:hypothetical protein
MIIVTTLVIPPGGDAGPFNLYSDSDGYTVPFATNVSAAALQAGYSSTVPNDATTIRVMSTGLCTNFINLNINLIPPTTTTTSSSTSTSSTTTTTTTICPCTYINITITTGYIIFSDTGSVQVTYTNCQGLPASITYTVRGTYTLCSPNINSIQGSYVRLGETLTVPLFPFNTGTLCCIPTTTTTSTTDIPFECTQYTMVAKDPTPVSFTYYPCGGGGSISPTLSTDPGSGFPSSAIVCCSPGNVPTYNPTHTNRYLDVPCP